MKVLDRIRNLAFCSAHFDFYIEEGRAGITFQDIFQARRLFLGRSETGPQLSQRVLAHGEPIELGIMADDEMPVACATHVKLKSVNAVFQRKIKRGQRIFRRIVAGAAMSEE